MFILLQFAQKKKEQKNKDGMGLTKMKTNLFLNFLIRAFFGELSILFMETLRTHPPFGHKVPNLFQFLSFLLNV